MMIDPRVPFDKNLRTVPKPRDEGHQKTKNRYVPGFTQTGFGMDPQRPRGR